MKINILGTDYTIRMASGNDPKLLNCSGYCEPFSKEIVIKDIEPDIEAFNSIEKFQEKILRHEILHAFLFECGLFRNSWAQDEEIVDFFFNTV